MTATEQKLAEPSFEMTGTEQKVWEEGIQACTAPDPQQALEDWSRRYKVELTNETVVTVTRTVTDGRLSPPFVELANVGNTRTTVNGVVSPLGEDVAPGDPVEAGACRGHCKDSFTVKDKPLNEVLTLTCKFKKCTSRIVSGTKIITCEYTCSGTAVSRAPA